jgi:phenylpropionate dioxygenase-like ring-hydroxylating dioxygenase large terminal subunit
MSTEVKSPIKRGHGTASSPTAQELLQRDSRPQSIALRTSGTHDPQPLRVPFSRYTDRAYAQREMERVWSKSWQFACREEDIPKIGDRYRYDVGTRSYIVIRSAADRIQAFNNSCLHRGTRLCDGQGGGDSIRCPFHGWEWRVDGALKSIPSDWDFQGIDREQYRLPELKVGTWGGFVFVNPDPDCKPLESALGILPEHFRHWQPEKHFTYARARKRVRANWKIVMEAFLESYHVVETHTDSLPITTDAGTQYDIWDSADSQISRLITPLATPSPHLNDSISEEQSVMATAQVFAAAMGPDVPSPQIDFSKGGRAGLAQWRRDMTRAALGTDLSHLSDAEMLDSVQYFMFPNFCPWYGEGLPLTYQFTPLGDDPDHAMMDVRMLMPMPDSAPCPPPAPAVELDFDDSFEAAPLFGFLTHIFDQDMGNLPRVQAGLKAAAPERAYATLGRYQECRITHFHRTLDRYISG